MLPHHTLRWHLNVYSTISSRFKAATESYLHSYPQVHLKLNSYMLHLQYHLYVYLYMLFTITSSYCALSRKYATRVLRSKADVNMIESSQAYNIRLLPNIYAMSAVVQRGYGRGSKKLGFPTSNLPQFDHMIRTLGLERGVYFGWSCIPKDSTNGEVYGIVANIGKSPTFTGQENPVNIVEAYMIDRELKSNFYDERIGMVLVGYLRPEQKFSSLNTLISQINADVEVGRSLTHLTPVSVPPYVDMEHLQRVKEVAVRIARDCAVAGSSDDCVKILQKESSAWQVKRIAGSSGSKSDWSCIAWKPT